MAVYQYLNFTPHLGAAVFLAPTADVIGNVLLADNVNIWFQTVVRGDVNQIIIGENTNIQDLCMLHVVDELPLIIGKNVSVGHKVTLHACTIADSCLIGMGATILDGAVIGENSVVAAGAVVPPHKKYPAGSMIMGAPAKVKRDLSSEEKIRYANHYQSYLQLKNQYLDPSLFSLQ